MGRGRIVACLVSSLRAGPPLATLVKHSGCFRPDLSVTGRCVRSDNRPIDYLSKEQS